MLHMSPGAQTLTSSGESSGRPHTEPSEPEPGEASLRSQLHSPRAPAYTSIKQQQYPRTRRKHPSLLHWHRNNPEPSCIKEAPPLHTQVTAIHGCDEHADTV